MFYSRECPQTNEFRVSYEKSLKRKEALSYDYQYSAFSKISISFNYCNLSILRIIGKPIKSIFLFTEAFKKVIDAYETLDIVVNIAGIMDDADWEIMVDVNYVSD